MNYLCMENIILKFGGSSLKQDPYNVVQIIIDKLNNYDNILVVFSALGNTTDLLLKLYLENDIYNKIKIYKDIKLFHYKFIKYINISHKLNKILVFKINFLLSYLENLIFSKNIVKSINFKNIVVTLGEKISITIFEYLLKNFGIDNEIIWSEYLIKTNENINNSFPLLRKSKQESLDFVNKLRFKNNVILTTGYCSTTCSGIKTTLGRNGSDFTATILSYIFDIDTIIIYTDVDGIMSANPKKVSNSYVIKKINFKEMSEFSYFGANVLHSKTLIPLKGSGRKLFIKNIKKYNSPGTQILENYKSENLITAITSCDDSCLITISGLGMNGSPGFASKIFRILEAHNINVSLITQSSSEQNICICINKKFKKLVKKQFELHLNNELNIYKVDNIILDTNISIITVIGTNMINKIGISGKIFSILGNEKINIIAICQGSSEISISFIVKREDELKVLNVLHSKLIL